MKRIKTGLTGFILGDWLGMPYRGKGKGTFKPIWTKSYLRGDKCSGNTSMLLCALDSRCNLELYQQNLRNWYFNRKYTGENIEFDIDQVNPKSNHEKFRGECLRILIVATASLSGVLLFLVFFSFI